MNRISILLSTYNGGKYLKEQLDSILSQSFNDFKVLVRDDGSTDNTVAILKEYEKMYPTKIKLIKDDGGNLRSTRSFMRLLENSDSEYVMFCDQDDVWLEDKIEITLKKMLEIEKENLDKPALVHTDLYIYENEKKNKYVKFMEYQKLNYRFDTLNRLFMQNIVTGCTMMINKKGIKKISDIPKEALMHDWWAAIVVSAFGKIGFVNRATILYRQHDNNTVGAKKRDLTFFVNKIFNPISLKGYFLQIYKFKTLYYSSFDEHSKYIVDIFLSLQKKSYVKSRYLMFKHKIYKQGIMINIALFLGKAKL